jgi:RimJ/RimL family protein N-acetyltransferase
MIKTERLVLRLPQLSDLEDIHALFSDGDTLTYWSSGPHASLEATRAWLQPLLEDPASAEFDFFIEMGGRIVGKMGCWRPPEVGFILNREVWGQGIAGEALEGLIDFMRRRGVCDHLWADVDPRNLRSKRLLEACGFRFVRSERSTIETHIGWCDSDYFRLDLT